MNSSGGFPLIPLQAYLCESWVMKLKEVRAGRDVQGRVCSGVLCLGCVRVSQLRVEVES
jgi:hypothetical protein